MKHLLVIFILSAVNLPAVAEVPAPSTPLTKVEYLHLLAAENIDPVESLVCPTIEFTNAPPECIIDELLLKGYADLFILKDYKAAVLKLKKYVHHRTDNPEVYHYLGDAYYHLENYDQALTEYTRAEKLNYKNKNLYYSRGNVYRQRGNCPQALKEYKIALDHKYYSSEINQHLGDCNYRLYQYSEALKYYDQALTEGENDEIYYKRAATNYHLKNYEGAVEDIEKALTIAQNPLYVTMKENYEYKLLIINSKNIIIGLFMAYLLAVVYQYHRLPRLTQLLNYKGTLGTHDFIKNYLSGFLLTNLFIPLFFEIYDSSAMGTLLLAISVLAWYVSFVAVIKRSRELNIDPRYCVFVVFPVINAIQFFYLVMTKKSDEGPEEPQQ